MLCSLTLSILESELQKTHKAFQESSMKLEKAQKDVLDARKSENAAGKKCQNIEQELIKTENDNKLMKNEMKKLNENFKNVANNNASLIKSKDKEVDKLEVKIDNLEQAVKNHEFENENLVEERRKLQIKIEKLESLLTAKKPAI